VKLRVKLGMKIRLVKLMSCVGLISVSSAVFATDLMDVYKQAQICDPVYRAAYSTMLSTQEQLPQSVAGVLPSISGTAYTQGNYTKYTKVSGFSNANLVPGQTSPLGIFKYNTNNYTITLSQSLFNFTNWMQIRQTSFLAKEATATFCAEAQDLIIRVATAYLSVLQAQDNLIYTQAQKAANARELDQTKQRYNVGLDAITSVYNAQAAYDAIVAQEIAAENILHNNQEALTQLTGQYYPSIEGLKIELPLIKPNPMNVEQWVSAAGQHNQTLLAARYAADAAHANIAANFGGHLPTLNAVSTYGRTSAEFSTYFQGTAGLELTVPIMQGGFVASQVRQAEDDFETAIAKMVDAYRKATISTRQFFNDVLTGISKITADRAAIISGQSSLDSTEESFKVGTRTIVDVLLAQQQLYQSRTVYAQDEYAYILSTLQLKQAAGTLCPSDLLQINTWLHGPDRRNLARLLQAPEATYNPPDQTDLNVNQATPVGTVAAPGRTNVPEDSTVSSPAPTPSPSHIPSNRTDPLNPETPQSLPNVHAPDQQELPQAVKPLTHHKSKTKNQEMLAHNTAHVHSSRNHSHKVDAHKKSLLVLKGASKKQHSVHASKRVAKQVV